MARPGSRPGVRSAVRAAGLGRLQARTARCCARARKCSRKRAFPIRNGKRVDARGEPIAFEFLIDEPTFEPHHMPFIKNLATLGIDATPTSRRSGAVQGACRRLRLRCHRLMRMNFSTTPGDSLRTYFSSHAAATKGSRKHRRHRRPGGRRRLIEKVIAAK